MRLRLISLCPLLLLLPLPASAGAFEEPLHQHGAFVLRETNAGMSCAAATAEEAMLINRRPAVALTEFGEDRVRVAAGLDIVLRGTSQLDANPEAKAAFERAAQIWETRIANPITVFVDVDFGTTRFGEPFGEDTIASASSDLRGAGDGLYPAIRGLIVARADNPGEAAIYGLLPAGVMPTDIGNTSGVASPSILFRAIGALPPTALSGDGAPSIGFNSKFLYDFNPSNGISPGRKDFEGVVVHEIGHMLGFLSRVGDVELGATINAPSIFDFFRFRPGITSGGFTATQRIQSSGGEQIYFAGAESLALSTGRGDQTGGDEQQASHWKDDALTGVRIGIMDPTLASGVRTELTDNDLVAFAVMGYNITGGAAGCSEVEPNETAASADALLPPATCGGSAGFGDAASLTFNNDGNNDAIEDVFQVTLSGPAKLDLELTFTNSGADLDLVLFTLSGSTVNVIDLSNGTTTTEQIVTPSNLAAGTYFIGISAFSGSSQYTINASSIAAAQPPAAPTNLVATAISTSSIRLTWQDNSNDETEFRIEQRTSSGAFVDLGAVGANSTAVNVSGFSAGSTGTFRVRARNAAGDSTSSNEASATTFSGVTRRRRGVRH